MTTRRPSATAATIALALALLAPLLPACDRRQVQIPVHTCLLVGLGEDDPLWPLLSASARSYVGTARSLKLVAVAPARRDPTGQADLARKNLDRTVSAVCLQSDGDEQTRKLVKELTLEGRPVILIGQDMPDTGRFGHIGWDEQEVGKVLATALKVSLQDRMTYMLLHADETNEIHADRLRGFRVGIQDYTFLRELNRFDCRAEPAEALKVLAAQSERYPQLGAWACLGDWPARAPLDDLRRSLPTGTPLTLVGAMPHVWPLLEQNLCAATVATDYGRWGYEAVSLSELAFHRAVKPGEVRRTEPRILRAAEINQFKRDWSAWTEGKINPRPPVTQPAAVAPR